VQTSDADHHVAYSDGTDECEVSGRIRVMATVRRNDSVASPRLAALAGKPHHSGAPMCTTTRQVS
jgi:hypothetical protein